MLNGRRILAWLSGRPGHDDVLARPLPARPQGELVWFHATTRAHAEVARQLIEALSQARPGLGALLTGEAETLAGLGTDGRVFPQPLHGDLPGAAEAFVDHWRPDIGIWTAGASRPKLLAAAHRRGVGLLLIDAQTPHLEPRTWRLLPGPSRKALQRFEAIFARDLETEALLRRRMGRRGMRIEVTGPLYRQSRPLPHDESDRQKLAAQLRGRPVWLAAHLHPDELVTVLKANAMTSRLSHRLLLILAPADPSDSEAFHKTLRARGLRYVTWSEGALPGEITQAILADTEGEMGLWYRIAPVSFMGSSLIAGYGGSDPNEPAAHGSAILYGPNIRNHIDTYSRLAEAGAARIVHNAETLGAAVQQVLTPDQSAAMAHAAWDVATRGAAVMDRIVDLVQDMLDRRRAG